MAKRKTQPVPQSTTTFPDKERIDLAAQLIDRAYRIGRALETMQNDAFDDPAEGAPSTLYAYASRELGARVRALTGAARLTLEDKIYDLGDAWETLHG